MEKKFRFTAEETVSNTISKLKKDSEELGRGLIRDARAYTTSGKETLAYIENQIKAIERRNQVEQKSQLLKAQALKEQGQLSPQQFKDRVAQIKLESKTDEQQVVLLRELIEAVKSTSKREIIEDRKGVDKQLSSDKQLNKLSPVGDELQILKRTLQRQELGSIKEQEREEKDRFSGVRKAGAAVNAAGGTVAGSSNEFFALAAGMAFIPVIGGAVSSLMQRAMSSAQKMQTNYGRLYGVTGAGAESSKYGAIGLTGSTYGEFYELQKQTAMARGGGKGAGAATSNVMMLERLGIDRGLLLGQERMTRGGSGGSMASVEDLIRGLQAAGSIQGQDFSSLSEYFDLSIQIQKEQLKVSGETNDNISNKLVAGISSIDESFKNPDVLRGLVPQLTSALSRPTTPQAEAFQFGILRRMKPGASLSQLQEMREAPTLEYFQKTLGDIKKLFPDEEAGVQVVKGIFGLEGQTKLARKLYKGDVDISNYQNQQGIINFQGRVGRTTGLLEGKSASWDRTFETAGSNLSNVINKFIEQNLPNAIGDFKAAVTEFRESTKQWVNKNKWIMLPATATATATAPIIKIFKAVTK